jgi:predicted N-acetyltransferase YhbS
MTFAVERLAEWNLSAADEAAIADLLSRCFATDFGGRSFFTHHHHLRLVIRADGIIGHMALVLRSILLDGRQISIAGLAEVATDPAHRGRGIAATLLRTAIAEAKASPAEFLLLFGVASLYAAAGFRPVANPLVQTGVDGKQVVTAGDVALMVLPLRGQIWPDTALVDLRGPVF